MNTHQQTEVSIRFMDIILAQKSISVIADLVLFLNNFMDWIYAVITRESVKYSYFLVLSFVGLLVNSYIIKLCKYFHPASIKFFAISLAKRCHVETEYTLFFL